MGIFSKEKRDTLTALNITIGLTTLAAHKSIIKAWTTTSKTKLTIQIDWFIRTEILFFFLIMTDRYAFATGGPKFRDNLQAAIVSQNISSIIKSSFNPSQVKKGFDKEAWHENMIGEVLRDYNKAEVDYGPCKELMNKASAFNEETIMGKLAGRITSADDNELNPNLTMIIFTVVAEALVKAQLQQKVEGIYRDHKELH